MADVGLGYHADTGLGLLTVSYTQVYCTETNFQTFASQLVHMYIYQQTEWRVVGKQLCLLAFNCQLKYATSTRIFKHIMILFHCTYSTGQNRVNIPAVATKHDAVTYIVCSMCTTTILSSMYNDCVCVILWVEVPVYCIMGTRAILDLIYSYPQYECTCI